jgi:hypothetical protein
LEEVSNSVEDHNEDLSKSAKHLYAPDLNHVFIFNDFKISSFITPLSLQPHMYGFREEFDIMDDNIKSDGDGNNNLQSSLTSLALSKLLTKICHAIQLVLKDPTAKEKSRK